jgi:NIMA (never in mitosis gene a)-related kinase
LQDAKTQAGTWTYMSPEILKREKYLLNTNIWSLGCVLFELMPLNHPFLYSPFELSTMIKDHFIPKFIDLHYSEELKLLIQQMLDYNPSHRISASNLERTSLLLNYNSNIQKTIVTFLLELLSTLLNKTKELKQLQSNFSTSQSENDLLHFQIDKLQGENDSLSKTVNQNKLEIQALTSKNTQLQKSIDELQSQLKQSKTEINRLSQLINQLQSNDSSSNFKWSSLQPEKNSNLFPQRSQLHSFSVHFLDNSYLSFNKSEHQYTFVRDLKLLISNEKHIDSNLIEIFYLNKSLSDTERINKFFTYSNLKFECKITSPNQ